MFLIVMFLPVPELVENPPVKFVFPVLTPGLDKMRLLLTVTAPLKVATPVAP